eukprot:TRINITY_DN49393_c0_g1_i1.p2 TRINITY_DN49393_c0_g1~~TRINITY_DN49393_c0_g1_i1.p2  ORF type:complete len:218 (-),score=7.32 TRINITY_DN49393_c0_g1_i1:1144-1797(-)
MQMTKWLVQHGGADVHQHNPPGGWSAFHLAVVGGRLEIAKWLIQEGGADPNLETREDDTPLELAVESAKMVELLLLEGWWSTVPKEVRANGLARHDNQPSWELSEAELNALQEVEEPAYLHRRGWLFSDKFETWTLNRHSSFPPVFQWFAEIAMWCLNARHTKKHNKSKRDTVVGSRKNVGAANITRLPMDVVGCVLMFWTNDVFSPRLVKLHGVHF